MAANSQRLRLTSFEKQFLSHICSLDSGFIPSLSLKYNCDFLSILDFEENDSQPSQHDTGQEEVGQKIWPAYKVVGACTPPRDTMGKVSGCSSIVTGPLILDKLTMPEIYWPGKQS
ncbi:Uncharacterized protein Fot_21354 [Forsythia ovata]|uniref:Uncharacterized protein n=1 Tax=Forsythia ovata TaxID=205694 RepID=A0ABD1UWH2_9LAMI